jgi:hypothetical protein
VPEEDIDRRKKYNKKLEVARYYRMADSVSVSLLLKETGNSRTTKQKGKQEKIISCALWILSLLLIV